MAKLKEVVGGEVEEYTKLLAEVREQVGGGDAAGEERVEGVGVDHWSGARGAGS